jgi:hypothetical protein
LNIYTLLVTFGGLLVLCHIVNLICNTIVARSYHQMLAEIHKAQNQFNSMELVYAPENGFGRFGDDDDDFFN